MGITVNLSDSKLLREAISRARAKARAEGRDERWAEAWADGWVEGWEEGRRQALAEAIERILQTRFPCEAPTRLADHLVDLVPRALYDIFDKSLTASSVAEALGSHVPARSHAATR